MIGPNKGQIISINQSSKQLWDINLKYIVTLQSYPTTFTSVTVNTNVSATCEEMCFRLLGPQKNMER